MSTFSGLSTALSSLYAQRHGLDITGQNIANANTEGYSRQRVDMGSVGAPVGPALFSTPPNTGSGVEVTGVTRLHDQFLEARARNEHASSAYLNGQQQIHTRIEQIFNEPSETGLQSQMSDLWAAFSDVANRPGDLPARSQLLQRASTLADSLNTSYDSVATLYDTSREQLDTIASSVNTMAANIAQLNQGILQAKSAGVSANELSDKRDALVLKVSELTGATSKLRNDGAADVYIGGSALVSGTAFRQVAAEGARRIDEQAATPAVLRWTDNQSVVVVPGGGAAATIETLSRTLPDIVASLDRVAKSLADTVNEQHTAGVDLNAAAGEPMFTGETAASIRVAITDPSKVAAASSTGGSRDGSNADALASLVTRAGGPDETYRGVVIEFAVTSQAINRRMEIQAGVTLDVDSARSSQSGVNLDEEMANLLAYQRAYEAASRVVSTIDNMLDTLINRMGA